MFTIAMADLQHAYTKAHLNYTEIKETFLNVLKNKDLAPDQAARVAKLIKVNETLLEICEKEAL